MLQSKQISRVLCQGLKPVPVTSSSPSQTESSLAAPISVSLLSSKGVPLSTVIKADSQLTIDNIKIYSLLAFNNYDSREAWCLVKVDSELRLVMGKLQLTQETEENKMYVVVLYDSSLPDAIAKAKLDGLTEALNTGLEGFS
ncbi:hypothetical protein PSN45_002567 [Yamadazyma tenuis]|uniref:Uncharacterized protein n=1 Tax=Candida tenuis (strain ATCC 10573 / BCRC 21748 / CBS 615 / JCM 9827 / NBRC 10315 / NRRL Y-1498 / VKM Y-70) TaxID=590646 RepID=G3B007_CANTC|nr:uncharacterized protein CANTEDRAFT_102923 [Yamadazyma tenuis ATCC 10573]EGV65284.1 hypothetical protein CANTEDRAFT_102923 [Yamadazyma tenuis ATCC 10573]WEJ95058.1 hypothetical protein PSN45_002567 [Yamadazyma tenuis]